MVENDKGESLSKDTKTSSNGIPPGYLSMAEIAKKYPDYSKTVEQAVDAKLKPTMKVMVYINEDEPIRALIHSKYETVKLKPGPKGEEQTVSIPKPETVTLPNKEPISMMAMDLLKLHGDPSYRFDLESQPSDMNLIDDTWGAIKKQCLEYNFRNIAHAGRGPLMARYTEKIYNHKEKKEELYRDVCERNDWWDKLPDFRILVEAKMIETIAPKRELEDVIWDVMLEKNIPIREKYGQEERQNVLNALQHQLAVYGMESMLGGKDSHSHAEYFMLAACKKQTDKRQPATKQ